MTSVVNEQLPQGYEQSIKDKVRQQLDELVSESLINNIVCRVIDWLRTTDSTQDTQKKENKAKTQGTQGTQVLDSEADTRLTQITQKKESKVKTQSTRGTQVLESEADTQLTQDTHKEDNKVNTRLTQITQKDKSIAFETTNRKEELEPKTKQKLDRTEVKEDKKIVNLGKFKYYKASDNRKAHDDAWVARQEGVSKETIRRYRKGIRSPKQDFIDRWGLNWNKTGWIKNEVEK
ncbi:MAG: hypothetical protein AAGA16_07565 [Cyanobacteria bacterium P01_E01_bin.35]